MKTIKNLFLLVLIIINTGCSVYQINPELENIKPFKAGGTFQDCKLCPAMVVVPPGEFQMGSPPNESRRGKDEGPVRQVKIDNMFAVGVYEVTFEEWLHCVDDGGCHAYVPNDMGWGKGKRPVFDVSWKDAKGYVAWLSSKTGHHYRLLTESEWEYVARAGTTTRYWWGDRSKQGVAACEGCNKKLDRQTKPAGTYAPNPFGLYDTQGNVWELVEDCWSKDYSKHTHDATAWVPDGNCKRRVVRGGSWSTGSRHLRSANRSWKGPNYRGPNDHGKGFRVAMTLDV